MYHSFLMQEGVWTVEGFFSNELLHYAPIEGEIHILHQEHEWLFCANICVLAPQSFNFQMNYHLQPWRDGTMTSWQCVNTLAGAFQGHFSIEEDCLINQYDSSYQGWVARETYKKREDSIYTVRGICYKGTRTIASWEADLHTAIPTDSTPLPKKENLTGERIEPSLS